MKHTFTFASLLSVRRIGLAALLLLGALSASAADPSGTWKFTVQANANASADTDGAEAPGGGRKMDATLKLKWANGKLTGTLTNRAGEAAISDATFQDDKISFTVERTIGRFLRKRTFKTRYEGTVTDSAIDGTIHATGRDDKPLTAPWHATRSAS